MCCSTQQFRGQKISGSFIDVCRQLDCDIASCYAQALAVYRNFTKSLDEFCVFFEWAPWVLIKMLNTCDGLYKRKGHILIKFGNNVSFVKFTVLKQQTHKNVLQLPCDTLTYIWNLYMDSLPKGKKNMPYCLDVKPHRHIWFNSVWFC